MPFKSKEQERYLQINEPEIYRDWVEKYGRFKAAESFSAEESNFYIRGYFPKAGKSKRYSVYEYWMGETGRETETKSIVSLRNEIPRIEWKLGWRDGDYSLEGTVRKVNSMYVFRPYYINGHFMYRDTDSGPIFRSKTQWDCVIEAIEYAYDYSIFKPRLKVEKQKKWWQFWRAESFGAEYDYDFQNQTITTITADNEAEARETFAENYDSTKEEWKIVGLRRTLVDGKPSVRNIDSLPDDDDDDDEDEEYLMDNFGDMEYIILRLLTDAQLEDEYGDYMREKEIGRKDLPQQLEDDYRTDGEAEYLREKYLDAESFGAEECVSCDTPDGYWRGLPLCSSSGEELCISCCACNMCRSKWNMLELGEQKAESFSAESKPYYEVMVDSSRLDNLNADFDGLTMDLQDSLRGYVFSLDYGEGGDEPPMTPSEASSDYMNQVGITTYSYEPYWDEEKDDYTYGEDRPEWQGTINFPEGKSGEGGEFNARVFGFKDGESQTKAEEKIMSHVIDNVHVYVRERDGEDGMYYPVDGYYAESFSAERKYQAVDVPLGMVCVLCENDKPATHRIVENGMPFFLCERHWFNYTMGAPNIDVDLSAESFSAENYYGRNYRGFKINKEGDEQIDDGSKEHSWIELPKPKGYIRPTSLWRKNKHWKCEYCHEIKHTDKVKPNRKGCDVGEIYMEEDDWFAESFNSYKVAPDLSSYTKAELVSSIAGPQGTAAYDEVVYDPIAQSRLSAESIDSFSPARLIVLGASIGVALGLYNTRRD